MKRHIRKSLAKVICLFHALTHMKDRMSLPKCNCLFYKGKHTGISPQSPPVNPANGIVLAVSIVIAELRIQKLVAGTDNRRAERKQQRTHHRPLAQLAVFCNFLVFRKSLNPGIIAPVCVSPVPVILAVRIVMLMVVTDQIVQRHAVMYGQIVNRAPYRSAARTENVA